MEIPAKLRRLIGLASIPWVVACGSDCESVCEKAKEDGECFDGMDCEVYCEDLETIADEDHGDCEDELESLLSCVEEQSNSCTAWSGEGDAPESDDGCFDQGYDLNNCVRDYCEGADYPKMCQRFYGDI